MATKRRSLEERINDRAAKVQAAQDELERLQAIQDKAEPRSEWADLMFTAHGIGPVEKDPDEELRLALLAEALGSGGGASDELKKAVEEEKAGRAEAEEKFAKAERLQTQLTSAVMKMASDLGIHGTDSNDVWRQLKERYGLQ
ncbi:hypothetical protein HMPREF1275_00916 [Propionibacterium sp. KPL1844]|nr:hypothetical protein HMPREF1275_00916 [Propionibacterium sp. KPL1844]